jgi:DnaK suppressor protein
MTLAELNKYRNALEARQSETGDRNRSRGTLAIEPTADEMDQTQGAQARDLAIGAFDRSAKLLHDIQPALGRIHAGSYGVCLDCECDISQRRLAAVPWASSCIVCQEKADRGADNPFRVAERSFDRAA